MYQRFLILSMIGCLFSMMVPAQTLVRDVVALGGDAFQSGKLQVCTVIGESVAGPIQNSSMILLQGFQPEKLFSTVVEDQEDLLKPIVCLIPNPCHDQFSIEWPGSSGRKDWMLDIYTILGEQILGLKVWGPKETIPTTSWPKGMYILQLRNTQGQIIHQATLIKI